MKPVSPVIAGFEQHEVIYGAQQAEYMPLPSLAIAVDGEQGVVTRWRMTWRERLRVLFGGEIYLYVKTFGGRLQPVQLDVNAPVVDAAAMPTPAEHEKAAAAADRCVRPGCGAPLDSVCHDLHSMNAEIRRAAHLYKDFSGTRTSIIRPTPQDIDRLVARAAGKVRHQLKERARKGTL
jgi:hypothetical protein